MTSSAIIALAAALAVALSTIGPAIGQGITASKAMESIARQPEAAGNIRSSMIIAMALMEALTIYGLLIAFTLSIDDFVISYFTAGSEVSTLAMQIYAMTRKRISPEVNALSTILFVTVLALLLIVNFREMHQTKQAEKRDKALQKDGMKGGTR